MTFFTIDAVTSWAKSFNMLLDIFTNVQSLQQFNCVFHYTR